jgi:methionyl-tRNA formyltransferase
LKPKDFKIVFFGTSEFAVASLDKLLQNNYNIVAVVTIPDKNAGRGQKIHFSPVKKYALDKNLLLLQPVNLKEESFIDSLKQIAADLQIVIAFRILPEVVWKMPPFGTFNLHASVLPQYRGAAPINWAIINGESETGVTTFFLDENIDTGKIIYIEKESISSEDDAGTLHDRLKIKGAELVIKSIDDIAQNNIKSIEQANIEANYSVLNKAPKIKKEDCKINWENSVDNIYNFIRGLSPSPCAYTQIKSPDGTVFYVKIFSSSKKYTQKIDLAGKIFSDGLTYMAVSANDGQIYINEIQLMGKKRLDITAFLRGFKISDDWKTC